tara:strand:- start:281 stop:646 length:366 start_codon:yes stop_codon:yes gene_type:complete
MKKNVLLIYPAIIGEIPTSLAMIAGVLKEKGFNVSTAINTFKKPITPHEFVAKARECEAEIVGISMLTLILKNLLPVENLRGEQNKGNELKRRLIGTLRGVLVLNLVRLSRERTYLRNLVL